MKAWTFGHQIFDYLFFIYISVYSWIMNHVMFLTTLTLLLCYFVGCITSKPLWYYYYLLACTNKKKNYYSFLQILLYSLPACLAFITITLCPNVSTCYIPRLINPLWQIAWTQLGFFLVGCFIKRNSMYFCFFCIINCCHTTLNCLNSLTQHQQSGFSGPGPLLWFFGRHQPFGAYKVVKWGERIKFQFY